MITYEDPSRREMIAAWVVVAVMLVITLEYRLLPALFAGLLAYELVHLIVPLLPNSSRRYGKVIAVTLLAIAVVAALLALLFAGVAFFRSQTLGYDPLLLKISQVLAQWRDRLPDWMWGNLPEDAEGLRSGTTEWLRRHSSSIGLIGRHALEGIVHLVVGTLIGALIALREALPDKEHGPLAIALFGRAARLADAFGRIVFAQVRIAALNTLFTAAYMVIVLPLFGVHLPLKLTLIAVTFLAGLLPVVGNLISNSIIVIASLSVSLHVALASLAFLVIIHKLEYFLNARIVGRRIEASAWELLIAMVVMEAIFGLAGLVAAPVFYAYLKQELVAADLV